MESLLEPEDKRAASLSQTSVSNFVASEATTCLICDRGKIILDTPPWENFLMVLADPPSPNDALQKALAAHAGLHVWKS